jgi:competence protein ComGC
MNENLKKIAEKIRKEANIPEEENFGSIIAILMIISITLTLIRILQECNKNKNLNDFSAEDKYKLYGSEIKSYSLKRGWFTKFRIKKVIRKQMSKEQYQKYGSILLKTILDTGENLKDEEIITLVEAINV